MWYDLDLQPFSRGQTFRYHWSRLFHLQPDDWGIMVRRSLAICALAVVNRFPTHGCCFGKIGSQVLVFFIVSFHPNFDLASLFFVVFWEKKESFSLLVLLPCIVQALPVYSWNVYSNSNTDIISLPPQIKILSPCPVWCSLFVMAFCDYIFR